MIDRTLAHPGSTDDRFSTEAVVALAAEFDGFGPRDPAGAAEYCVALDTWIEHNAHRLGDPDLEQRRADLWFMQGLLCHVRVEHEEAIRLLEQSIEHSEQIGYTRRQILGLRSIAMTFDQAGMQDESSRCIFEALELAEQLSDKSTLALVTHALTALYQSQSAFEPMLESAMRTQALAEEIGDAEFLVRAYSAVGVVFGHLDRTDAGFTWIDRAIAIAEAHLESDKCVALNDEPLLLLSVHLNRVFLLRRAGRIAEALTTVEGLIDAVDVLPPHHAATISTTIAELYLDAGDLDRAQDMLDRSAVHGESMTRHLGAYYSTAAALLEARGNPTEALEMMRRRQGLDEETRGRAAQARLTAVERRFSAELAAKAEEIEELRTVDLVAQNRDLVDLLHQKHEILNLVVHDLRNPLTATQLLGEYLMIELSDQVDPSTLEHLQAIRVAAAEMSETINVLLTADQSETFSDPAPAHVALQRSVDRAQIRAAERGVTLDATIEAVDVVVDNALVRRSLDDYLSIAIDSTEAEATVRVILRSIDVGVDITITAPGTWLDTNPTGLQATYIARRLIERMTGSVINSPAGQNSQTATIELRG